MHCRSSLYPGGWWYIVGRVTESKEERKGGGGGGGGGGELKLRLGFSVEEGKGEG